MRTESCRPGGAHTSLLLVGPGDMTQRTPRAARASGSVRVVALLMVQAVVAATFAVLTARQLGPSDRGVIVIMMTLGSFLMLMGSFGVATGGRMLLSQSAPDFSTQDQERLAWRLSGAHIFTMVVVAWPLLVLTNAWRGLPISIVFALYGAAMVAIYLLREALQGIGRHVQATLGDVLMFSVLVVGFLGAGLAGNQTILTVASLLLLAAVAEVGYLATILATSRRPRQAPDRRTAKALLLLSAPALLASVGQAFTIRGDRLVLGALADPHAVGIYGTAATFTEMMWLVPMGVGQVIFRLAGQGKLDRVRRLQAITLAAMLAAGALGAVMARPAVSLLLGPEYEEALPLIWILLVASLPMGVYHLNAPLLNGSGDLKGPALAGVASSVVLIVFCVVSIPHWGAYGAAIGSFIAYSVMATVVVVRARRLFQPRRRP